jgi:serine phosphatase RsbU (regulator of sigma subunit)/integral membrane sensor domain MASE1
MLRRASLTPSRPLLTRGALAGSWEDAGPAARGLVLFAAVALAYFAGAQVAYHWFGAGISPVFFPSAGITLGALALTERRHWPIVLAGAGTAELAADLGHDTALGPSLGWVVANTAEPLLGATLLRLFAPRPDLRRRRDALAFLGCAVLLAPLVGGCLAVANAALHGLERSQWATFVGRWWLGDGLGVLVAGSVVLVLVVDIRARRAPPRSALAETVAAVGVAIGTGVAMFATDDLRWAYGPVVALSWIAIRLGTQAVALAGAGLALVAAQAVSSDPGFWRQLHEPPRTGLVYLQLAIGVLIATALLVAAEVAERERAVREQESAEQARRRTARLHRLTAALADERDPVRLPAVLARELAEAAGAVQALLFPATGPVEAPGTAAAAVTALATRVIETGEPLVLRTPSEVASALGRDGEAAGVPAARAAWAVLPLPGERGRVGAVLLAFRDAAAVEEDLLAVLARQAGVALERAELARAEEAARREGEQLRALIARLAAAVTVEQVARAVVTESRRALDASATFSVRDEGERWEVVAHAGGGAGAAAPVRLPLVAASGAVLGELALALPDGRAPSADDEALMTALAAQAAQALERARLLRDADRARIRAELLTTVLTELEAVPGAGRRARRLVELLVPRVADHATIDPGRRPAAPAPPGPWRHLEVELGASGDPARPLVLTLELRDEARRPYDAGDLAFVRQLASRASLALEGARLLEVEHAIAVELQRALLPDAVVDHPRVAVVGRYRPGDDRLEVGGDWFETVELPNGRIGIGAGDVVGKGLRAAAVMGRLRTVVAALAPRCPHPGVLLTQLEAFAETVPEAQYSTACFAVLDPETGDLRHASAGHPPMLVLEPGGAHRVLEDGRSWPLCTVAASARAEAATTLATGATLLLYSDGLVERRGEPIDAGIARLAAAAARHQELPVDALCEAVIAELTAGERLHDDIVLVAVRRR